MQARFGAEVAVVTMHILVVLDHPQAGSFSSAVADHVRCGALEAGHTVEFADLAAERFDGAMSSIDLEHFRGRGPLPDDVRREQLRIEQADALVIVFPIYWWSLPARDRRGGLTRCPPCARRTPGNARPSFAGLETPGRPRLFVLGETCR